ncbi:hypothetical protein VFPPC_17673 [Pochonia chlamydosporia 170]|uniref:Uncharacterized protein n=1 Tax=Pochonia chlamydosporia 170 TaxID=1380566 RepID=A0A219AQW6_METCM|nr:hypothetical protein VFPPC_17673 [Pochonia chlamydosporia 170]OWT43151.1 hypothetical protein VFPPC_17673 [Pochonia chlamydosporia 170]
MSFAARFRRLPTNSTDPGGFNFVLKKDLVRQNAFTSIVTEKMSGNNSKSSGATSSGKMHQLSLRLVKESGPLTLQQELGRQPVLEPQTVLRRP